MVTVYSNVYGILAYERNHLRSSNIGNYGYFYNSIISTSMIVFILWFMLKWGFRKLLYSKNSKKIIVIRTIALGIQRSFITAKYIIAKQYPIIKSKLQDIKFILKLKYFATLRKICDYED